MTNIKKLLAKVQPSAGSTKIIAIDGHGGSGKSSLASWLAKKLDAEVIHTDDFASWDNPFDWWSELIKLVLEPISQGKKVLSYPRSSWWEGHTRPGVLNQRITPIVILEGVTSSRKEFRKYIALEIFVDTPKEICLERGITRDLEFGKSRDELEQIWQEYYLEEEKYMKRDNPQEFADIVVDGTRSFEKQLDV
jgi:uridine kinase